MLHYLIISVNSNIIFCLHLINSALQEHTKTIQLLNFNSLKGERELCGFLSQVALVL